MTGRYKGADDCRTARRPRQTLRHPEVQGLRKRHEAIPALGRSTGHPAARAPRPATRVKQATAGLLARGSFACGRLPRAHPSGQLQQAFRLQLRGQLRNPGKIPSPHSLFTPLDVPHAWMSRPSTKVSAAPWSLSGPAHRGLAIARQQFAVSRQNCGVTTTACDDKAAHRTPKHHCMSNPMPGGRRLAAPASSFLATRK